MDTQKLTVFTPAYNRAHTLPRPYESLCRQSCKDFVWLIVDDGSSDGLSEYEGRGSAGERGHEIDVGARDDGAEVLHGEVPGGEAGGRGAES